MSVNKWPLCRRMSQVSEQLDVGGIRWTVERLGHREDEVRVADRQQLLLPRRHQALRAAVRHFGQ